ncbi:EamA domain containing protein [Trema orientale]|uniref:EamA domain containing protein n=1 Tax=Trema orientale TaxID=63057 RepID=A0A2P5D034_TREOI|nr:EamA domain containing protein [Trema orientale]
MASQSLSGGWSWSSSTSTPVKVSSSSLSNPIVFFSFHTTQRKRHRFSASSLRDSSSSPTRVPGPKQGLSQSVQVDSPCTSSKSETVLGNGSERERKRRLSFKTLFGKRSLWRRIFFASKKVRSIIVLNVVTLVYASSIPVVKEVEAIVDPASFTVVRFALSAIPFIPFVLQSQNDVHTRNAGIELGFWVSLGYLMQALGLLTSDAGRASFLSMLTVIVVPLLDGMLGAVVPARTWFAALMSVLGVAMLESSGSPPCVGDLLNFLSALFFGVHMLRTEHIARHTKKEKFLPLLGYEVCVVAVLSTTWYLVGGWSGGLQECDPSLWTLTKFWNWMVAFPWIPALYTGIFSSGLCLWGEMAAMRDVSATETAIIYALEPVWGGGFAWFLLGERWGTAGWVGAALVLGGSLTVQIFGSSPSKSCENESVDKKIDRSRVSDKRKGLAASPVVVKSRKDVSDLLK